LSRKVRGSKTAPIRGPGRPRANGAASENPRDELLRAAAKLFSTKGVAGTRITDIAEEVGIRPPSVYYHFRDLGEILRELLNFAVFDATPYVAAKYGTPPERLSRLIVDQYTRLNQSGIDIWFVMETSQISKYHFPEVSTKVKAWHKSVGKIYEDGVRSGDFVRMEHEVAVAAMAGLTYGAYRYMHGGRGFIDPQALADTCVRALGGTPSATTDRLPS